MNKNCWDYKIDTANTKYFIEELKDDRLRQGWGYDLGQNLEILSVDNGARKNGEGILNRLFEHKRNAEKDYWTEAVIFTTSNNSLGPTEISYLENKFCNMANEANRYVVKNGNDPSSGNITEEKESEMEEFIGYSKIIMGALRFKVFVPLVDKIQIVSNKLFEQNDDLNLFLERKRRKSGDIIKAYGKQTAEGIVVLRGSQIERIDSDSIPVSISELRKKANIDKNNILQEDILFNSPSYASVFVLGMRSNGKTDWKDKDGKTLNDLENEG